MSNPSATLFSDAETKTSTDLGRPTPSPKKKPKKFLIASMIVIVLFFVVRPFLFAGPKNSSSSLEDVSVERRDISVTLSGTGVFSALSTQTVVSPVEGEILSVPFSEGDLVEKGSILYTVDSSDFDTSLSRAYLAVESSEDNFNQLLDSQSDLTVSAPASGTVISLSVEAGDTVTAGMLLAEISERNVMFLKLPFLSSDIANLSIGASAQVLIEQTYETFSGTVSEISALTEISTGGALVQEVTIRVPNPGGITEGVRATAIVSGCACNASGSFSYPTRKLVYAPSAGEVQDLFTKKGDTVSKDTPLLRIQNDTLDAQVRAASRALTDANLSLQTALDQLEHYSPTADFSGTVAKVNVREGQMLSSGSVSVVLYDLSSLEFSMDIDELYIDSVEVGQPVEITADAFPGQTFPGTVHKISLVGSASSGVTSYPVTIRVESPASLLPGMNVTAVILVDEATDVLCVPVGAISRGNTVLVKREGAPGSPDDNVPAGYERIEVTLGRSDSDYIEVLSGLSEGDFVGVDTSSTNVLYDLLTQGGGMGW